MQFDSFPVGMSVKVIFFLPKRGSHTTDFLCILTLKIFLLLPTCSHAKAVLQSYPLGLGTAQPIDPLSIVTAFCNDPYLL